MKFYAPVDAETGRTILCGTQDDARKISKKFDSVEIATDKVGLMAFAQEALDTAYDLRQQLNRCEHEKSIAPVTIDAPAASDEPSRAFSEIAEDHRAGERAKLMGVNRNVEALTSDIMQLEGWPLGQCALAVASRFTELGEAVKPS
jgi:hypothetical protein